MEKLVYNESDLLKVAKQLFDTTLGSSVFAFYGKMGVGKTTFIKAICEYWGVDDMVTSPTFAIVNEYVSQITGTDIFHFDFYRIKRIEEAYDIGFEEYLTRDGLCLIEWPEIVESLLPENTVRVEIEELEDGTRKISWNEENP